MIRYILLLVCLISTSAVAGPADWEPFEAVAGRFVLNVRINGIDTKASLALDMSANSINESFLQKHDIPYDKHTRFDLSMMGDELEMSRLSYHEDDSDIGLRFQPWFDAAPVFQVDYANRRLRFMSKRDLNLYGIDNVEINKRLDSYWYIAALIDVDGQKYSLAVDNPRATFTTVSRDLAQEAGWLTKYSIDSSRLGDKAADFEEYDIMLVPNAAFGPYEFEYLLVLAYKDPEYADRIVTDLNNVASSLRLDGFLGLDVLSNFVVTYDYYRRKVHVGIPE